MPDSTDATNHQSPADAADPGSESSDQSQTAPESLEQAILAHAAARAADPPPTGIATSGPSQLAVPDALRPPDVIITDTKTDKGLGVYAARAYQEGEVVEVAPVLMFEEKFRDLQRCLQERVFDWGTLANTRRSNCLPLGCGSMYNHDEPSNLATSAINTEKLQALVFTAVRDIEPGEELTINYNAHGGGHTWHNDNWFEQLKIDRVKSTPSLGEREAPSDDAVQPDEGC